MKRIHRQLLESSRNLDSVHSSLREVSPVRRWLAQLITPMPLAGLDQRGALLLKALEWLEENAHKCLLSEAVLLKYHKSIYELDASDAGQYRTYPIKMENNPLRPPEPQRIPIMMKQLDHRLAKQQEDLDKAQPAIEGDVVRAAVETYHRIGVIHPFVDANGRVARLAMNHLLRRYGLGYVIFPPLSPGAPVWKSLAEAGQGNLNPLVECAKEHMRRL